MNKNTILNILFWLVAFTLLAVIAIKGNFRNTITCCDDTTSKIIKIEDVIISVDSTGRITHIKTNNKDIQIITIKK